MSADHDTGCVLARALAGPACYPHAVDRVVRLETHISWIFLTGRYAYKIKKPVDFGFLDFTTLDARRRCCEDEVRLNRRLAPALYLDVVPICGTSGSPRVGGNGPAIEYAVRMCEFPQHALASRLLDAGGLTAPLVGDLARRIAAFHASLPPPPAESRYGSPEAVLRDAQENFTAVRALLETLGKAHDAPAADALREWTEREFPAVRDRLRVRAGSSVRECHGDLHLGNIVLIDGKLVPFDCVEFNAALRWIDVMNEVAFMVMDLLDRGADALAWLFLDEYLEASGDYAGVAVVRFYLVYRAMVRAKVHLLRASQCTDVAERRRLLEEYRSYVKLAQRCTRIGRAGIVLMHGYSGCGKTTVARDIVRAIGGIRVRSDVERKRLHGLPALQPSGSAVGGGLYTRTVSEAVYSRLLDCAAAIAGAGYTAVVDATFLARAERARFSGVARGIGVPAIVIDVQAPRSVLDARVGSRRADASEATSQVLERQIATAEPIEAAEGLPVVHVDGCAPLTLPGSAELLGHLQR
ncbi:MAG TPA: AAA family ATPase [Burkholderiales bacterium]|nr:AAA family ATPase [Burkholderiales bacterium]